MVWLGLALLALWYPLGRYMAINNLGVEERALIFNGEKGRMLLRFMNLLCNLMLFAGIGFVAVGLFS